MVAPEYPATGGRADYALLDGSGKPVILVEAKKLGESLDKAAKQGIQYTLQKGVLYFVATDGQRWEVYETHKPVPLAEKRIVSFDVGRSISDACRKALALWRPSVLDKNSGLQSAPPPLQDTAYRRPKREGSVTAEHDAEDFGKEPRVNIADHRLPLPGLADGLELGSQPPHRLRFPDGSRREVEEWIDVIYEAANWLYINGHLTDSLCPIKLPRSRTRYLVATKPVHPTGRKFFSPRKVGTLYLEAHASSTTILRYTEQLIRIVGEDPARFHVIPHVDA